MTVSPSKLLSNKQSVEQNLCPYKGLAKQKKKAAKVTEKDQGNYVDSSRNTAVNLDSKELSKTLKKIKNDEGEIDNTGIVNSDMYQREAQHYASKGLHGASSKNLSIGKLHIT